MLQVLTIRDFAIIDRLSLDFDVGLTVITGETGAGKSILVNALNLVLGGRGSADVVRTGADAAHVEAVFDVEDAPDLRARLVEAGVELPVGEPLIVRRVFSRTGRHRAYLNDAQVTLSTLARVTSGLVDISGQHEHYSLLQTDFHLDLIDRASREAPLLAMRDGLRREWEIVNELDENISTLETARRSRVEREAFLRFQLEELTHARLDSPDEEDTLETERRLLRNAEKLRESTKRAEGDLYSDQGAAVERLSRAARSVRELVAFDETLSPIAADLEAAAALAEDSARTLSAYARRVHSDPDRLEAVESRLSVLSKLRRKHGASLLEVIARREQLALELLTLASADSRLEDLGRERHKAALSLLDAAQSLTAARGAAGKLLCRAIETELADLGMTRAKLDVRIEPLATGLKCLTVNIGPRGADRVEFLLSANPGEPPAPLSKIASGGELSRFMLAVKRVIAESDPVGTYVFDEVDAGVGGPTAVAIGRKLALVSQTRQALCITHLPQIAALADRHLHVSKVIEGDRTHSDVRPLEGEERVRELARMLGGERLTEATLQLARELISSR